MTIPFAYIPSNVRVPLFYAEVSNANANTAQAQQRALIIGQITSAGVATPNVPIISQGVADAQTQGGVNSMLASMVAAFRANNSFGELWYLPLADDGSASAAAGSFAFTAAATASGVLSLYVAGVLISLPVTSSQTTSQLATALAALINATVGLPVTASASSGTVTMTAVNKGLCGNDIDIRVNYGGSAAGQVTPTGLTYTITAMSGGLVNPTAGLTTALANLGTQTYDFIICPYTDTVSLGLIQTFLNDSTGRWSYSQQLYGHCFAALRGTFGSLITAGAAQNNQHTTILGFYDFPTPEWVFAAAYGAQCAASLTTDPATPLQNLQLTGVLPPPLQSQFTMSERNSLLYSGIATYNVQPGGVVALENIITTYQKNVFGSADNSYLEVETMFTLMYVLRFMNAAISSKYARMKLAANGTVFGAGANIVTPNLIRSELIAQYTQLEYNGYVQNSDAFAAGLIVQQNASNPNRVDVLWPGTLIDQLRIFAVLAQFRLQ